MYSVYSVVTQQCRRSIAHHYVLSHILERWHGIVREEFQLTCITHYTEGFCNRQPAGNAYKCVDLMLFPVLRYSMVGILFFFSVF